MLVKTNLVAWQLFIVACRAKSISQAALLTDMDLPKASRLIAGLEKELGYELFDKSRRPIQPTARAMELCASVAPLVSGFQAILDPKIHKSEIATIRFAAPIELAQEYFSSKLCLYSEMNPGVEFEIIPEMSVEDVRSGAADVIVLNRRPADPSELIVRRYHSSTTVALATSEYLRRFGIPKAPEDFRNHKGLLQKARNDRTVTNQLFRGREASKPIVWRRTFVTHDQLTLKRLLLDHHGITVDLALFHIQEELRRGDVVPILPGWSRAPRYMCLVNRRDEEVKNAALRNFIQWLITETRDDYQRIDEESRKLLEEAYGRKIEL